MTTYQKHLHCGEIIFEENMNVMQQEDKLKKEQMDIISRGGAELMNSELLKVKGENERLMARVHELVIGNQLREEAIARKYNKKHERQDKFLLSPRKMCEGDGEGCHDAFGRSKTRPWFKLSILVGLTLCMSVAVRNGLDV
eukprot:gene15775-17367_t